MADDPMSFDPDSIRDGEHEYRRLKRKVKDYVKKNLRDYLFNDSVVGRRGKKLVQIPITGIRLPSFERDKRKGGVGQGEGEEGQPLPGQRRPGQPGQPGTEHEEHEHEMEIVVDEILEILQEALELPNIEDKGKRKIVSEDVEYTDLRKIGPECLLDIKRTLKNSLVRTMCGATEPIKECPPFFIEREDRVFKTWREKQEERTNAVVFAIMDISGSMGQDQKKIVSTTMFWIEQWLKKQYKNSVEIVHIVHDTEAWEVSYEDFYSLRTGGGTAVSSALKLCDKIIDEKFPHQDWNIYPFFFSDGDNVSDDNESVIQVLNHLIEKANQICYGQVHGEWGNGELYKFLLEKLGRCEKLCVYEIRKHDDILGAIKKFLGRGR